MKKFIITENESERILNMHKHFTSKNYLVETYEEELDEQGSVYSQEELQSLRDLYDKDPSEFVDYSKHREEMKSYDQDSQFSELLEIIMDYLDEHPNEASRLRKMLNAYTTKMFEQ
jgi:hypothetical protein